MKRIAPRNFLIFALAALAGTVLLHTSQSVQRAEAQVEELKASVQREREKIRLLKAEWASLNRPERLEKMAREFLDLVPPQPEKLVDEVSVLPDAPADDAQKGLFEPEGAGAQAQTIAAEGPAAPPESPVRVPVASAPGAPPSTSGKAFGDLMRELEEDAP